MSDCNREYFLLNGTPKPISEFPAYFNNPLKYIYEVFRVQQGIPLFIEDHLERLWNTARLEGVRLNFSMQELLGGTMKLIHINPPGDGNIKIVLSETPSGQLQTFVYFTPHQYPTPEEYENGVYVKLFFAERENPNAKVMDTLLRRETDIVKSKDAVYEVLLVDRNGYITEGSRSNVFFINSDRLVTPPVQSVLEGITRKKLMQICENNGINVTEQAIHHNELADVEAVFLTGTSRRVLPVREIDGHIYSTNHTLIRYLQKLFEQEVMRYIRAANPD